MTCFPTSLPGARRAIHFLATFVLAAGSSEAQRTVSRPALPVATSGAAVWNATSGWTVVATPVVRIGSVNGAPEVTFGSIGSAALTPSGRIVIVDNQYKTIRLYDRTGKHVLSMGRPGDGPGEFPAQSSLTLKVVSEDTVLVSAGFRRRAQRFSFSSRTAVAVRDITSAVGQTVGTNMMVITSAAGGSTIFVQANASEDMSLPADGKIHRLTRRTIWGAADLSWTIDMGEYQRGEEIKLPSNPPRGARSSPTSGSILLMPESPNFFVAADPLGSRACIGSSSEPRVKCYDRNGGGIEIVWKQEPQPLTAAEIQKWRTAAEASLGRAGTTVRPEAVAMLRAIRIDRNKPFFASLIVDSDLNLWVDIPSKSLPTAATRVFAVFDQKGRYLGDVKVPRGLNIRHIAADRILGTVKDANDVQSVVVHEIKKGG